MRFQCSECQGIIGASDDEAGQPMGCGHCGEMLTAPATPLSPTAVCDDYVIIEALDVGSTESTFRAFQLSLNREVVLKTLNAAYADNMELIVAFVNEARAAAEDDADLPCEAIAVGAEDAEADGTARGAAIPSFAA